MKLFENIETIFVDLDDTIWDFTANSKVTMKEVFHRHSLQKQCAYEKFIECYLKHNSELWKLYHHGKIEKQFLVCERFRVSFEECGIKYENEDFPKMFNEDYLNTIVKCHQTVEGAKELLDYLTSTRKVHVLSNGFKNLQYKKLLSGGLEGYISELVLSDDIDVTKPNKKLFDYALTRVNGKPETTVMIGDDYDADICGAHNAGWKTIFFNRKGFKPESTVADLTVEKLLDIKDYL